MGRAGASFVKSMPEISVLMTIYNDAAHVEEAINSVLAQTFTDLELIIMDDASTDESAAIIQAIQDDRIRFVQNDENIGLTRLLNKALALAQGEYIARMDSDDICLPDRFAKQIAFLYGHEDIGVVGSWVEIIGEQAGTLWKYPASHVDIQAGMLFESQLVHPAIMMKREVLQEHPYDEAFVRAQDYELWVRLAAKGISLANLPEVLLKYRLHEGQIGAQHEGEQIILADRVRLRQLRKLGLAHTKTELFLHQKISLYQFEQSEAFLTRATDWLERIEIANRSAGYFDHEALISVLGKRWWTLLKSTQGLGFKTWQAFQRSSLRVCVRASLYERVKFGLYCLWNQVR